MACHLPWLKPFLTALHPPPHPPPHPGVVPRKKRYLQDHLAYALLNVRWLIPHWHLGDTRQVYQGHRAAG